MNIKQRLKAKGARLKAMRLEGLDAGRLWSGKAIRDRNFEGEKMRDLKVEWRIELNKLIGLIVVSKEVKLCSWEAGSNK